MPRSLLLGLFVASSGLAWASVPSLYIAFGDSITAGFDDSVGAETGGYTNYLEPKLQATDPAARVLNYGKTGEQAGQALARIQARLAADDPEFTLLMEGINDLRNGASASTTALNVQFLVQACLLHGTIPIVATILPDDLEVSRGQIQSVNGKLASLAGDQTVIGFNDAYSVFAANPQYFGYTHPDQAGYRALSDLWYDAIGRRGHTPPPPPESGTGDLDGSGLVDGDDLIRLALAFGSTFGESTYDFLADVNGDGVVDGNDLAVLTSNFGKSV